MSGMAPLGALSRAWVLAEASKPLDWSISGIYRFGELWVAARLPGAGGRGAHDRGTW